jgi:hypothetical protein
MTGTDLQISSKAVGKLPTVPTWALANPYGAGWTSQHALAAMSEDQRRQIPAIASDAERLCQPMNHERLVQRLTALGMVMSPNRPPAEASMWVRETARLLSDIAEDVLCESIDELQKRLKFLPTIAEIRELADPVMERRRSDRAKLDAMRRYLESGKPIGEFVRAEHKRPIMDRRGEEMTEAECEELNRVLESAGACSRYRPDGSRYEVAKRAPHIVRHERPQMPTRADYIAMGVDADVLDKIEAEKAQADTRPKGGDGTEIAAPFTSGPVGEADAPTT